MPVLVYLNGAKKGKHFRFDRNILVGRGPLADLEISDPAVSRRHAVISWADERCFVSDLQSGNGTYVNDARISEPQALGEGDRVAIGSTILEYRSELTSTRDRSLVARLEFRESKQIDGGRSVVMRVRADRDEMSLTGRHGVTARLRHLEQRLDFVAEVGRAMTETLDEGQLLARILLKVFDVMPQTERAFIVHYEPESGEFVPRVARTKTGEAVAIPASRTLLQEAVEKRQAILSADTSEDDRYKAAGTVRSLSIRSVVCVPLLAADQVYGVLQVDTSQKDHPFSEADLGLLVGIGSQIALSIANARLHQELVDRELLEHDLALARRIQQTFLPKQLESVPGYRFAVEYSPAQAVGGDFFDLLELPDHRWGIAVGDVSGKGVSASLFMARATSALRRVAGQTSDPVMFLRELNDQVLSEGTDGMFATLLFAILDPATGGVEMVNAGHLPPLLRLASGRVSELELTPGSPLGVQRLRGVPVHRAQLGAGDLLTLYSDGVCDAENPAGERFGTEGLATVLGRAAGDADVVLGNVLGAVRGFLADRPQPDDLTLLLVGRQGT
ncbi:MAG: SpoIIE family protein phosphatase [Thermoanaerobaculia bacterium]